ncbi:MAG TPA: ATP phosphoribosyltransferase [Anaerolineae bacterium]|nr:ATP phosphoribosyltransferase [Anaerolineae bacterium]HID85432.1 ATP phosphoribosyltransferase [Anaerolineales bacterium]HIQ08699.1 ATP phosphoribosyltransferase [Anaerolineaceae bacterium]
MTHSQIRLSLPSKGRLGQAALDFLAAAGLRVDKPNPRQYIARIPALPDLTVLFQRAGDIVVSVRDGSVDFGITGLDLVAEKRGENGQVLVLHEALGFGHSTLTLAVPEDWPVHSLDDLRAHAARLGRPLRVATKFPNLTGAFLNRHAIPHRLIAAEGTLETAPAIGYADLISDLVSSGQTLRDNRLRPLSDGAIQPSQAVLIANREALRQRPEVLAMARRLLEYIEAHLRAQENLLVIANMRGESPEAIAQRMFTRPTIGGLQGPTISPVYVREGGPWYAVSIVVRRDQLPDAIADLRAIGGSGIIVTPVTYIFEEEPPRYKAMLEALRE